MIVCAGNIEQFSFATPIGIGLVDSAINLSRLILMNPPEYLVFVGTAGSYGKKELFEIVESRVASNIEHSFLNKTAYTPIDNVVSASENVSHETIVNSSNYITASKDIAKKYLSLNIDLENMEFFSVLKVAQEFKIPVAGIFVVTNYCYESAHEEFKKNHAKAMQLLDEHIRKKGLV